MGLMLRFAEHWIDRRPAPLDLSDSEILDWMSERCEEIVYKLPTPNYTGGFTVKCYGVKTFDPSLRGAICLAAAKYAEVNK